MHACRRSPCDQAIRGAAEDQALCVVVSSVRKQPEMCEHLQNELYASSGVARALDGGGGEILISHNLDHYNMYSTCNGHR